jgi:hypothetical protein
VGALVGALRRWYELNPDERAGGREMGEWVMNAINLMCNDDANLDRFAHSYKPKPPKDFAQLQLEQFKAEVMDTALLKLDNVGGPVTPDATQGVRWRPFGWQETAVRHHTPSETQDTCCPPTSAHPEPPPCLAIKLWLWPRGRVAQIRWCRRVAWLL